MIEARRRFGLAEEPPTHRRQRQDRGAGHLERDLAAERRILGQEDDPETTAAQLAHDREATELSGRIR